MPGSSSTAESGEWDSAVEVYGLNDYQDDVVASI